MKVGDYVRTKYGINKIIYIDDIFGSDGKHSFYTIRLEDDNLIFEDEIINSSPNIIDLIEVGDYVNGSKVLDIVQAPKKAIYTEQETGGALLPIVNNRIESVLTKEQFESMEYKVKE